MKKPAAICAFPVLFFGCDNTKNKTAVPENNSTRLRHSIEWISKRLLSMHAVDDAYIIEFGRGEAGGSETAYDHQMQVVRVLPSVGHPLEIKNISITLMIRMMRWKKQ